MKVIQMLLYWLLLPNVPFVQREVTLKMGWMSVNWINLFMPSGRTVQAQ